MSPEGIIRELGMQPHPEGGWYVQTFRDTAGGARGHSTAIYYLLTKGQRSHWHRVHDAAEVWHYYAGAPLALHRSQDGMASETLTLGTNLPAGERPQAIIPANWWQSAEPLGDFTLVGCTVSPGFEFSSFEMAPADWKPGG
ncbi:MULTISPECIES: cupin domain-containing protein [Rhizobium]|uniref:Cupin n=1 Tax=Rhizobium esperanzae TaxID=1967781 RepID=A0A246DZZ1_9HYPH|nr:MULTISPECIES: cupin domain-containing protein [Rhizobium]ANK87456.1 cupin 5 domain-containing protein [Rhizobium sp. N731]ANK93401.1 cupin 5 domain-containing protein [Rhizobium sp. N6212]ANK99447.1 cupin 5 domain-containing protein [Rhizobium sp. N621]ANL05578.1 cupin 5 domain-containing protein [Rhizobium esperanzae]ANL11631.1 cupin 5 domain-containing protein [Rhizobium sp. N1341]